MKINKFIVTIVLLLGLLVGSLGAGVFLSQWYLSANAAPPAQEDDTDDAGDVEDDDTNEPDDADEDSVSPDQAGITADQAKAAAEAANSGAKALEADLENENGALIYEVELDNGLEVQVDANNGNILGADPEDAD
jgi:uncharacterized membrane protein YkoI